MGIKFQLCNKNEFYRANHTAEHLQSAILYYTLQTGEGVRSRVKCFYTNQKGHRKLLEVTDKSITLILW